jgi:hypothetical protein
MVKVIHQQKNREHHGENSEYNAGVEPKEKEF